MDVVLCIGAFAVTLWDAVRNPDTHSSGRIVQIVGVTMPVICAVILCIT